MAAPERGNAAPKLCYAPPGRIPHAPHVWFDPHPAGRPDEVQGWTPRYCDGWAAALPGFLRGLRHG